MAELVTIIYLGITAFVFIALVRDNPMGVTGTRLLFVAVALAVALVWPAVAAFAFARVITR